MLEFLCGCLALLSLAGPFGSKEGEVRELPAAACTTNDALQIPPVDFAAADSYRHTYQMTSSKPVKDTPGPATVFVLAAHVPTRHQANILMLTLFSVQKHHSTSLVVLVDNTSPTPIDLGFLAC